MRGRDCQFAVIEDRCVRNGTDNHPFDDRRSLPRLLSRRIGNPAKQHGGSWEKQ